MDSPFVVQIFDKAFSWIGVVGAPKRLDFTLRFTAVGLGEIDVASDDPMLDFMLAKGSRVRVTYKDAHLMSGPLRNPIGDLAISGLITFAIEDDYRLMPNTLGWVMPTETVRSGGLLAPLSLTDHAQAWTDAAGEPGLALGAGHYRFDESITTAEAAVKDLISKNMVTRLGRPVTVVADSGRGGDARSAGMLPSIRMARLDEAVADLLAWSGLGLRFGHDGVSPTITADVWEPVTWPLELSMVSGTVTSGSWSLTDPNATRIVVGGPGEDVARAFWSFTGDGTLEDEYGDIIEVFRDATGATLTWPDALADAYQVAKYYLLRSDISQALKNEFIGYLNAAGLKGLMEGAPVTGLELVLSETEQFRFGPGGYDLGDLISVVTHGITFTDRITEVHLSLTSTDGVQVTPRIGNRTDDPDETLARAVAQLAASQRRLSTNR